MNGQAVRNHAVAIFLLFGATVLAAFPATAFELEPYKDRLFAYPTLLESRDGGAYRVFDYRELRDINGRDQVPERRVKRKYVDFKPRREEEDYALRTSAGDLRFIMAGDLPSARIVTVYIHGRGGDRKQGANDYSFGGNFNRIKNLMVRNSGVYVSADAGEFSGADLGRLRGLLDHPLATAAQARLVLACGSAGGTVCHHFADKAPIAQRMAGIVLLGSFADEGFFGSAAYANNVPLMIAHGGSDPIIPVATMEQFYSRLKSNGYPVRMVRFETGTHGTPIRMLDWRETINWMLAQG